MMFQPPGNGLFSLHKEDKAYRKTKTLLYMQCQEKKIEVQLINPVGLLIHTDNPVNQIALSF